MIDLEKSPEIITDELIKQHVNSMYPNLIGEWTKESVQCSIISVELALQACPATLEGTAYFPIDFKSNPNHKKLTEILQILKRKIQ